MLKWFCVGLLSIMTSAVAADAITIVYPKPGSAYDARVQYPLQLLALGFEKSGVHFRLQASDETMSQSRALKLLAEQNDIDVVWTMTSREREAQLLPVRIPIYKGLIGWRVTLLLNERANLLRDVRDKSQLAPLLAGQGHDWPDTTILKANGLTVAAVSNYESLFRLLTKRRIDYFPRSIVEIQQELESHHELRLTIDPYVLIHYPSASYFFFNRHDQALAKQLENGLNAAIKDGSFDRLFRQHHQAYITPLNLHKRHIIELQNPFLPDATPLQRRELWFDPLSEN